MLISRPSISSVWHYWACGGARPRAALRLKYLRAQAIDDVLWPEEGKNAIPPT